MADGLHNDDDDDDDEYDDDGGDDDEFDEDSDDAKSFSTITVKLGSSGWRGFLVDGLHNYDDDYDEDDEDDHDDGDDYDSDDGKTGAKWEAWLFGRWLAPGFAPLPCSSALSIRARCN